MDRKTTKAGLDAESPEMPVVPGFAHRFVHIPGLRAHVATSGEGEPVLMLHGLPQHWWQWRRVGPALGERYRVICPDARGFGWSEAASPRIARYSMRDDVLALLDALELERVRLVAHDMGAVVAAQLAYAHPERVRAMVVLSVPPPFMRLGLGMLPAMRHVPKLRYRRAGSSLDWVFAPPYVATPMSEQTRQTYLRPLRDPAKDAAISEVYRGLLIGGEMPALAAGAYRRRRLAVPALYCFGEKDEPLTAPFVRKQVGDVSRFADHVEFAAIADAAHFATDDNPDGVVEPMREFFARAA
ncbi:alpha/beta hydrolase [Microbacterium sp. SLBN-154]|uniref:alpha/beta hydrolase n=1 Tax=Microbacterium sp. SLBN-154 TaxID=2768458 RepID=UPI0011525473|nr:alpha/beta fold hydrolase [Microbacterium sp. SLBN-154]